MNQNFTNDEKFDLVIIGGGPAGYTAAIKGALQGFKVAIVEKQRIGGACINRGCIPTKALWGTALELKRLQSLKLHGIKLRGKIDFDFSTAVKRQFAIIDQMVNTIHARMKRLGVQHIQAEGVIERAADSDGYFTISLKPKGTLRSRFVLIATGSRPAETEILQPDHKLVLTTDDIVLLKKLPSSITIVGGGVVACEFASILNIFGVKINMLEHSSQLLSAMDPEVVQMLMTSFKEDGIQIFKHTNVTKVIRGKKDITLHISHNEKIEKMKSTHVLLAIGRKPNSENLGLEKTGVQCTPRGHILVDDRLETNCKGIFAAGDVVGGPMLAHKAWYDALIAVRAMCGEECRANYNTVPAAIFTIPEMASVGMQPDQARQKGLKIAIGKFLYSENSQALCVGETEGMMKAVIDRDTNKIIGCTMYGYNASNLIAEVALAMSAGLSTQDISNTIHPHPTLSEMVWESFLDTQGLSVHKV